MQKTMIITDNMQEAPAEVQAMAKLEEELLLLASERISAISPKGANNFEFVINNMIKLSLDIMLSMHATLMESAKLPKHMADDVIVKAINKAIEIVNLNATLVKTRGLDPDVLIKK